MDTKSNSLATILRFLFLVVVFFGLGRTLTAQTTNGTVSGIVTDSSGAVVPGATVHLRNVHTAETLTTTSNPTGLYLFPSVPAGDYALDAVAKGFKQEERTGITIEVNQNGRVDFTLQVGNTNQVVQVHADVTQVDTRDVQLGGTVDANRVVDLPLNGRNVYDLTSLMPGVTNVSTVLVGAQDMNEMNVNGQNVRSNNYYLEGSFNGMLWRNGGLLPPNPDAVEEFHLLTSNFDPEFGRLPGSVINVVLRSGGNQLHGSGFEFLRNNAESARSFFAPSVAALHWNQFGGSVGGPIRKDKTFFFASYQGLRLAQNSFESGVLVPTAAERVGNFSALPSSKWPINPATGQVFPGGIITTPLDPVAQNILSALVPLPNAANGTFSAFEPAPERDDQGILRIDHQLAEKHKLSGSLLMDRSDSTNPFNASGRIAGTDAASYPYAQNQITLSDSWIISPTLLSETHLSSTSGHANDISLDNYSLTQFGSSFQNVGGAVHPPEVPSIVVSGNWQLGGDSTDEMPFRTWGARQSVSWIKGNHSFKFGADFLRNRFAEIGTNGGAGQLTFSGQFTGNALADYDLGQASYFRESNGAQRYFTDANWGLFVQDDWKVSRHVTLDLGLRWEVDTPYTDSAGRLGNWEQGVQSVRFPSAPLGLVFPGDPGVPAGILPTIYTDFAPRIGLAYDVFGNGKTAVRAGFGLFYNTGEANFASDMEEDPFFVAAVLTTIPSLVNPWGNYPGGEPSFPSITFL